MDADLQQHFSPIADEEDCGGLQPLLDEGPVITGITNEIREDESKDCNNLQEHETSCRRLALQHLEILGKLASEEPQSRTTRSMQSMYIICRTKHA